MTLRIPLPWLLLPFLLPFIGIYWIARILLGLLLCFLFSIDDNVGPTCEILEERDLQGSSKKKTWVGKPTIHRTNGRKIKACFTPSFPMHLLGVTPQTLVIYRMFDLEKNDNDPQYRDEDGNLVDLELSSHIALTKALRAKAKDEKKKEERKAFQKWKGSADPEIAIGANATPPPGIAIGAMAVAMEEDVIADRFGVA